MRAQADDTQFHESLTNTMASLDEKELELYAMSLDALRLVLKNDEHGLAYVKALRVGSLTSAEALASLQKKVEDLEDQLEVSTQMIVRMSSYITFLGGDVIDALLPEDAEKTKS